MLCSGLPALQEDMLLSAIPAEISITQKGWSSLWLSKLVTYSHPSTNHRDERTWCSTSLSWANDRETPRVWFPDRPAGISRLFLVWSVDPSGPAGQRTGGVSPNRYWSIVTYCQGQKMKAHLRFVSYLISCFEMKGNAANVKWFCLSTIWDDSTALKSLNSRQWQHILES